VSENLFAVFLQGRTLSEIRALRSEFGLGQIVHTAVANNWDTKARDYIALAGERAKARALITIAQGIDLAADMMGVMRKMHGDNMAMYMMTGDVTYLEKADQTPAQAIKQLKEIVEALMKLTGQDQKRSIGGTIEVKHSGLPIVPTAHLPLPEDTEADVLSIWATKEKEKIKKSLE